MADGLCELKLEFVNSGEPLRKSSEHRNWKATPGVAGSTALGVAVGVAENALGVAVGVASGVASFNEGEPASDAIPGSCEEICYTRASIPDSPVNPTKDSPTNPESPIEEDGGTNCDFSPSQSTTRARNDLKLWASWMSDFIYARTDARHSFNNRDFDKLETVLAETTPLILVIAFYKFCNRPKGICGLNDVFGMLWREWSYHKKDAEDALRFESESGQSVKEILEDLHSDQFLYEQAAREKGRTLPSMSVLARAFDLTNESTQEVVA